VRTSRPSSRSLFGEDGVDSCRLKVSARVRNVNFFGSIAVDVEHELAKLDPSGYRPLRERASAPTSILV
jgi:hypothetical protein